MNKEDMNQSSFLLQKGKRESEIELFEEDLQEKWEAL